MTNFDDRLATLLDDMRETMIAADGVDYRRPSGGHAAPRLRGVWTPPMPPGSPRIMSTSSSTTSTRDLVGVYDIQKNLQITHYHIISPSPAIRSFFNHIPLNTPPSRTFPHIFPAPPRLLFRPPSHPDPFCPPVLRPRLLRPYVPLCSETGAGSGSGCGMGGLTWMWDGGLGYFNFRK